MFCTQKQRHMHIFSSICQSMQEKKAENCDWRTYKNVTLEVALFSILSLEYVISIQKTAAKVLMLVLRYMCRKNANRLYSYTYPFHIKSSIIFQFYRLGKCLFYYREK